MLRGTDRSMENLWLSTTCPPSKMQVMTRAPIATVEMTTSAA